MASDGSTGGSCCVFVLVWCGWGIVFFWASFSDEKRYYAEQQPAMCMDGLVDGHVMSIDPASAQVLLDPMPKKSKIPIRCLIPVAVYPCKDGGIEPEEWRGTCSYSEAIPFRSGMMWPRRNAGEVHVCKPPSIWKKAKCEDSDFQEASESCSQELRHSRYPCFIDRGGGEVRAKATGYPVWLLVGALACTKVLVLLICAACVFASTGDAGNLAAAAVCSCGWISFGMIMGVIILQIRGCTEDDDVREGFVGSHTVSLKTIDSTVPTTTSASPWMTSTGAMATPQPVSEKILLAVFGVLLALGCIGLLGLCAMRQIRSHGEGARAKAAVAADVMESQVGSAAPPMNRQMSRQELNELVKQGSGSLQKKRTREELGALVRQTTGLSRSEVVAHQLLSEAEATVTWPKRMASGIHRSLTGTSGVFDDGVPGSGDQAGAAPPAQSIGLEDIDLRVQDPGTSRPAQVGWRSSPFRGWWNRPCCPLFA
uniref:Transmembrane protein n=1 Tax=Pyrodinium bahamense TaxID=73915 RepID=A0A7S0A976_9DINO